MKFYVLLRIWVRAEVPDQMEILLTFIRSSRKKWASPILICLKSNISSSSCTLLNPIQQKSSVNPVSFADTTDMFKILKKKKHYYKNLPIRSFIYVLPGHKDLQNQLICKNVCLNQVKVEVTYLDFITCYYQVLSSSQHLLEIGKEIWEQICAEAHKQLTAGRTPGHNTRLNVKCILSLA